MAARKYDSMYSWTTELSNTWLSRLELHADVLVLLQHVAATEVPDGLEKHSEIPVIQNVAEEEQRFPGEGFKYGRRDALAVTIGPFEQPGKVVVLAEDQRGQVVEAAEEMVDERPFFRRPLRFALARPGPSTGIPS